MAGYGGNGGNSNKQVQPTFGVSFGLPQSSNGYPVNPYGQNPLNNPYGPAFNGGGINLGLLSVNPLLAVQVTKNDYGEKVVKPFVNLHVTPNEHVVNKLSHLFHEKKLYLLNKHQHYHHHNNPHHHLPPYYEPQIHYPHHPPHHSSHYGGPPVYSPHHSYQDPSLYTAPYHHKYKAHELPQNNDDYYDDDSDYYNNDALDFNNYNGGYQDPSYGRSANVSNVQPNYANRFAYSRSLTLPSSNPGATRGGKNVRFPTNRKKRETDPPLSKTETISEVTLLFTNNVGFICAPKCITS